MKGDATAAEEQGFYKRLGLLAKLCRFEMDRESFADVLALYDRSLSSYGYNLLNATLDRLIQDRGSRDAFPSIREIRELIEPATGLDGASHELLTRCIRAVALFGYMDPAGARQYVGELAWEALPDASGWTDFCRSGERDHVSVGTARAQLRDRLLGVLRIRFPSGRVALPAAPAVPQLIASPAEQLAPPRPTETLPLPPAAGELAGQLGIGGAVAGVVERVRQGGTK